MSAAPSKPHVVIVAGPNGAGKSTSAPNLLRDALEVEEFVNADTVAAGLSAFRPESVAVAAGRVMLRRMRQLAAARANFAFETTLATRSLAPRIAGMRRDGYDVHILFLSLVSADLAVSRVVERVRQGGHDVPELVVRRRYTSGLRNFFTVYRSMADTWQVFDNSELTGPRLIASGRGTWEERVLDGNMWRTLVELRT